MASFSKSPAALQVASGATTFIPPRFTASTARLHLVSGETMFSIIAAATVPRIERLRRFEDRAGGQVQTTAREQIVQQRNAEGIEDAFAQVNANIAALQQTLNLALSALAKATALDEKISVEGSYTSPTSVGSANSTGTVSIAAHTRFYTGTEGRSVSVDAGSVTGQTGGSYVTVFYRDAARAGGAVTYEATTSAIAQTGNIHIVWQGTIPNAGEPDTSGTSPSAPGYSPPPVGNPDYLEP